MIYKGMQEPRNCATPLDFVKSPHLLITVPTYNEAENIGDFLTAVFADAPVQANVIIIDDSSPDGTAELVEKLIKQYPSRLHLAKRPEKQGGASAFLQAFAWGLAHGFDAMLAMDADFSHDPKYIKTILEKAACGANVVIGSRLVKGGGIKNRSFIRDSITKCASLYCRILLSSRITEWTGGYNLWTKKALETIDVENVVTRGYSFQLEMKYKAISRGCSVVEVPITFYERQAGLSKMPPSFLIKGLVDAWLIRWMCMKESARQFIKYVIIAGLGTMANLLIFFILADKLYIPSTLSSIITYIITAAQNYILHHSWTFAQVTESKKRSLKQWGAYTSTSLVGLAVNILVLNAMLSYFVLPFKVIAQGCGIAVGFVVNFCIAKYIVFKKKSTGI